MLKESLRIERKEAVVLEVDFTAPTICGYACAWLSLTNNARECRNKIWKITNERETSMVYIICNPKYVDEIKKCLNGIVSEYIPEEDRYVLIGKVINEYEITGAVPVYEYSSDADNDEEWSNDMDNAVSQWFSVREEFI